MKKLILIATVLALLLTLTACGSQPATPAATDAAKTTDAPASEASAANAADEPVTVEYGDYDSMFALSIKIQNMEMDGKTVVIDGELNQTSSWSIGMKNSDGIYSGTKMVVEGMNDSDMPARGTRIRVTGVVHYNGVAGYITVRAADFEIVK